MTRRKSLLLAFAAVAAAVSAVYASAYAWLAGEDDRADRRRWVALADQARLDLTAARLLTAPYVERHRRLDRRHRALRLHDHHQSRINAQLPDQAAGVTAPRRPFTAAHRSPRPVDVRSSRFSPTPDKGPARPPQPAPARPRALRCAAVSRSAPSALGARAPRRPARPQTVSPKSPCSNQRRHHPPTAPRPATASPDGISAQSRPAATHWTDDVGLDRSGTSGIVHGTCSGEPATARPRSAVTAVPASLAP